MFSYKKLFGSYFSQKLISVSVNSVPNDKQIVIIPEEPLMPADCIMKMELNNSVPSGSEDKEATAEQTWQEKTSFEFIKKPIYRS